MSNGRAGRQGFSKVAGKEHGAKDPKAADHGANGCGQGDRALIDRSPLSQRILLPVLVILAGLVAFGNSRSGAFVFDDDKHVLNNPRIRKIMPLEETMSGRRPIVDLSLALNYDRGEFDPRGYHVFNLAVHLLAGLTLFGIVGRTLRRKPLPGHVRRAAPLLALLIAMIWLVHPLQTQSVTYVIQRAESMMGLFYLLTLYCVIRGAGSFRRIPWYAGAVVFCALGMGCKAVMVTAPLVVFLYDWAFISRSGGEALRRRSLMYFGLMATWTVLGACGIPGKVLSPTASGATVGFGFTGISPFDYLTTQAGAIAHYLRLSLWPHPLCLDYNWPVARTAVSIVLPGFVIVSLLVGTVWGMVRRPALGFAGVWFFLILAPTSSFIPIKDPAFEHRMYLPLAAVVAVVVVGGYFALRRACAGESRGIRRARSIGVTIAAVVISLCVYRTWVRNADYESDLIMWRDVTAKRPANHRAYLGVGTALFSGGDMQEAQEAFAEAVRIKPNYADGHYNFGNALNKNGKLEEAVSAYRRSLRLRPGNAKCHYNLGNTLKKLGKLEEAIAAYRRGVAIQPGHISAHINLGNSLKLLGRVDEAVEQYHRALDIDPRYANAHFNLADALKRQDKLQEALAECKLALQYDPKHRAAQRLLEALVGKAGGSDTD